MSRVLKKDRMNRNVDGSTFNAMLVEGNILERPMSDSSGIADCDVSSISSVNEDLMNDILRDFDSTLQLEDDRVAASSERLLRYVENNTIGNGICFQGPFGDRAATYCDYTASGRSLKFIENYIDEHVRPLYANTHTTTNVMARQTTRFREEAREIIKTSVNANEEDVLIFSGSGTTGAIHKLVGVLEINKRRAKKTVVFVGPYEHHSNILPWKEAGATVHRIRDTTHGNIDTRHLRSLLKKYSNSSYSLIGCFSAASNVTGVITDTRSITSILHEYGALSFWDYATAAPYLDIDMNPTSNEQNGDFSKDAIFLSPHKFVGGPGTPGILIAKRRLFRNSVPTNCGGGTVLYVTRDTHIYLKNPEEREEGGTPAIVESIRAGLVFQLKDAIGTELIEKRENEFVKLAFEKFKKTPEIVILGSTTAKRLPIFSFLVRHPQSNKLLHHNFVAVLLNDLYGVQVRSGCACAGPYAQDLLGIDEELAKKFTYFLLDSQGRKEIHKDSGDIAEEMEIMKPGFTRLNLPYFASHEVVKYILDAVVDVAKNGWKLLPQYSFNKTSGSWFHQLKGQTINGKDIVLDSLHNNDYYDGRFNCQRCPYEVKHESGKARSQTFQKYLSYARKVYRGAVSKSHEVTVTDYCTIESSGVSEELIWFMQPHEALELVGCQGQSTDVKLKIPQKAPFTPKGYADENGKPTGSRKKHSKLPTISNTAKSSVCTIL
ncbi:cysteine desulfurase SufS-like [Anneissia japonica]|uniref:cysteine desulfurase SufS-like n=1 Tax=Anneissia japonica TaxID=1529436 RepID=UPI0014258D9C|nr:cysteine desulfurase SufS-like [Anneissia japonica]